MVGFGSTRFNIAIYIANRPHLEGYPSSTQLTPQLSPHLSPQLQPLLPGDIEYISQQTGNHWRKVFNVSAKFLFQLRTQETERSDNFSDSESSWQQFRDHSLYQQHSSEALLFSPPEFKDRDTVHIVAGKTYARALKLENLVWLDDYFAVNEAACLVVCPYLDYRQLSNVRIETLVSIVLKLQQRIS